VDRQAKRLGGLEVDDELEVGGLLDRQVSRLGALQNLIDKDCGTSGHRTELGHEAGARTSARRTSS